MKMELFRILGKKDMSVPTVRRGNWLFQSWIFAPNFPRVMFEMHILPQFTSSNLLAWQEVLSLAFQGSFFSPSKSCPSLTTKKPSHPYSFEGTRA